MTDLFYLWANSISNKGVLILIFILIAWSLIWKGLALWRAAKLSQKKWFIALLILNTAGILEIIYLFVILRKSRLLERKKNNL